jgi:hypothetical protein
MKKVVLTLAAALVSAVTIAQTYFDLEIDETAEKGSFYNPVIVNEESQADPYIWVYIDKANKEFHGVMIYGYENDINEYFDSITEQLGKPIKIADIDGEVSRKEFELITEDGILYFIYLLSYNGISKLYVHELNSEESIDMIKYLKKDYIKLYGKEQVNKWLGK